MKDPKKWRWSSKIIELCSNKQTNIESAALDSKPSFHRSTTKIERTDLGTKDVCQKEGTHQNFIFSKGTKPNEPWHDKKKQNVVGYGFQLQGFTPQSLYWVFGGFLLMKPQWFTRQDRRRERGLQRVPECWRSVKAKKVWKVQKATLTEITTRYETRKRNK